MASSQDQISGKKSGQTSYGIDAALPCPGCGYDLRATPRSGDRVGCPECGGGWTTAELAAHAAEPYLTIKRLLVWTFAMPVAYAALSVFSACVCALGLWEIGMNLDYESELRGLIMLIVIQVGVIGLMNRGVAGRWASRMTQSPVRGGQRSGGWY